MKKTTHKRGLALLLSLMLLLSMLPTAVMVEGENKNTIYTRYVSSNSPTGSGTQGEPNGPPSSQTLYSFRGEGLAKKKTSKQKPVPAPYV